MRPPFLARLKDATSHEHEAVEAAMSLDGVTSSLDSYRAALERLYGFHAPIEDALASYAAAHHLPIDISRRRKADRLLRDLHSVDRSRLAPPPRMDAPRIVGAAQAFGILYVVEGSTLGGRIILREVGRRLGLHAQCGAAFFAGYAERTGPMWTEFCDALAAHATDAAAELQIVASARETFASFRAWIEGMNAAA